MKIKVIKNICRAYKVLGRGWRRTASTLSQRGQNTLPKMVLLGGNFFIIMVTASSSQGGIVGSARMKYSSLHV